MSHFTKFRFTLQSSWQTTTSWLLWSKVFPCKKMVVLRVCYDKKGPISPALPFSTIPSMQSIESLIWHEGRLIMILWPHVNCQPKPQSRTEQGRGGGWLFIRVPRPDNSERSQQKTYVILTYHNQITSVLSSHVTLSNILHGPIHFWYLPRHSLRNEISYWNSN